MQTESRDASLLAIYAEVQLFLCKDKESYSDERINNWKSLLLASHFYNLRRFVVTNATNRHYQDKPCGFFFG